MLRGVVGHMAATNKIIVDEAQGGRKAFLVMDQPPIEYCLRRKKFSAASATGERREGLRKRTVSPRSISSVYAHCITWQSKSSTLDIGRAPPSEAEQLFLTIVTAGSLVVQWCFVLHFVRAVCDSTCWLHGDSIIADDKPLVFYPN
jgi:hypothetical protein